MIAYAIPGLAVVGFLGAALSVFTRLLNPEKMGVADNVLWMFGVGAHGNIYYSMGHNGHGLAFAQLCGKMIAASMAGERSELTDHLLVDRRLWGAPSTSLSYLGINAYKLYYRLYDRWLELGV
jgi:glycine/D-amino acid oxidase-like deaminating enzyme